MYCHICFTSHLSLRNVLATSVYSESTGWPRVYGCFIKMLSSFRGSGRARARQSNQHRNGGLLFRSCFYSCFCVISSFVSVIMIIITAFSLYHSVWTSALHLQMQYGGNRGTGNIFLSRTCWTNSTSDNGHTSSPLFFSLPSFKTNNPWKLGDFSARYASRSTVLSQR